MSEGISARILRDSDRARALEYLRANADENLILLDYVERLGGVLGSGEMPSQIYGGFDGDRLVGVVLLRPWQILVVGRSVSAHNRAAP